MEKHQRTILHKAEASAEKLIEMATLKNACRSFRSLSRRDWAKASVSAS